jgi:hypothetical protein
MVKTPQQPTSQDTFVVKKALKEGIDGAYWTWDWITSTKGSKIYAVLKGALDAGLNVPHNDVVLPDEDRITGETHCPICSILGQGRNGEKILPIPGKRIIAPGFT